MRIHAFAYLLGALLAGSSHAEPWHFVALGDTAYNLDRDLPVYERLIGSINASSPAFTIHVGDTWGALACTEENYQWVRGWFDKYQHPVIYTPGDNEWTDCRHPPILEAYTRIMEGKGTPEDRALIGEARRLDNAFAATSYADTLGSLATIRRVYFATEQSLGARTMPLTRQGQASDSDGVPENARWERDGVVFATVSVPGSAMGFTINDERRADEAIRRNRANVAWIKETFEHATQSDAKAVVIAMHASLFEDGAGGTDFGKRLRGGLEGPFFWVALAIRDLGAAFGKPVLLVHGDFHEFVVDRPFLVSQGESRPPKFGNITRLQVFGAPELKAVRVDVDTSTPWVFGFEPLY
ncbi:MAG TPA: hypothetical protein VF210_10475 [Pseudomonadales bacterium]